MSDTLAFAVTGRTLDNKGTVWLNRSGVDDDPYVAAAPC